MKLILNFIFLICSTLCFAQSKQELIDSIIKGNVVDSECSGIGCSPGPQYLKFEKLKKMISEKELLELAANKNPTIRTYAILEITKLNIGDIPNLFEKEMQKNETIDVLEGCLGGFEKTYDFLYYRIFNKFQSNTENEVNNVLENVDILIINSKKDLDWLLYKKIFESRKFDKRFLPRIEELAFKENNFYALNYLKTNYSNEYASKIDNYLTTRFLKARFKNYNKIFHLYEIVKLLLESNNEKYKKMAVEKVKSVKELYIMENSFKTLFEKYGIQFVAK